MYDSWDMEWDRQNFLSFWAIFYPFTPQTIRKIKILKKGKKAPGDIIGLHQCTTNDNHHVLSLRCSVWRTEFFVILDHFLPFYPTNNPKNQNFQKN